MNKILGYTDASLGGCIFPLKGDSVVDLLGKAKGLSHIIKYCTHLAYVILGVSWSKLYCIYQKRTVCYCKT